LSSSLSFSSSAAIATGAISGNKPISQGAGDGGGDAVAGGGGGEEGDSPIQPILEKRPSQATGGIISLRGGRKLPICRVRLILYNIGCLEVGLNRLFPQLLASLPSLTLFSSLLSLNITPPQVYVGGGNNNGNDRSDEAFRGKTMPNGTLIGCLEVIIGCW
jgi:hypothetical protein